MNNPKSEILYDTGTDSFYVKSGFETYPAAYLTIKEASLYASMSRCRLPTDAEWQFAAKGGVLTNDYLYSGSNNLDEVAWYYDNSNASTHEIGKKKSNELGIFDMTGNVSEWCLDYYTSDLWYYNNRPAKDPCMIFSLEHCVPGQYICKGGNSDTPDWGCELKQRCTYGSDFTGFRLVFSKAELNYY